VGGEIRIRASSMNLPGRLPETRCRIYGKGFMGTGRVFGHDAVAERVAIYRARR